MKPFLTANAAEVDTEEDFESLEIQLKMLPEEAINAATINGACAMEIENEVGSIAIGKKANLIFTKPIFGLKDLVDDGQSGVYTSAFPKLRSFSRDKEEL